MLRIHSNKNMNLKYFFYNLKKITFVLIPLLTLAQSTNAYSNPREANGQIVSKNCHLAQKPVEIESPSAVLPNSLFKTVVKIPYDLKTKQIVGFIDKGGLNVGAIIILLKLAPPKRK